MIGPEQVLPAERRCPEMKKDVVEIANRSESIVNEYFSGTIEWWIPQGNEPEYDTGLKIKRGKDAVSGWALP